MQTNPNNNQQRNAPRNNNRGSGGFGGGSGHRGQGGGGYPQAGQTPESIPSPYNFVPLSDKVFFPDWDDKVSQDVPFSDGISGEIELTLTAQTPVYIRNGGHWPDNVKERNALPGHQSFFKLPDNRFAIPGTSLKGVIRSLVETASFGKMTRVSDHRYGFRDLQNPEYKEQITVNRNGGYAPAVKAGWLVFNGDQWDIIPCDFGRVEQSLLDTNFGTRRDSAIQKYNQYHSPLLVQCTVQTQEAPHHHSCGNLIYKKVTSITEGNVKGTLVFTGQPMPRNGQPRRKHMEFLFFNENKAHSFHVPPIVRKDFEFIHSDDRGNPNEEWHFWKNKMKAGAPAPVFYLEKNGQIDSMGLAMMYRLPYKHRIHEMLRHTSEDHRSTKSDLADIIFGQINVPADASRGRVHFGHLIAQGAPQPQPTVATVLGSPKPTFYPNYIRQDVKDLKTGLIKGDKFKTYNHDSAELSGWKRYPVRQDKFSPRPPRAPTPEVETKFCPLPAGTVFKGSIRVHNLRPAELGALLWALTWGGKNNFRHNIGMGKPHGFGSVSIDISPNGVHLMDMTGNPVTEIPKLVSQFKEFMASKVDKWAESDQLRQLQAMADPAQSGKFDSDYPVLNPDSRINHFADFKGANHNPKLALLSYVESTYRPSAQSKPPKPQAQTAPRNTTPPAPRLNTPPMPQPQLNLKSQPSTESKTYTVADLINEAKSCSAAELLKKIKKFATVSKVEHDRLAQVLKSRTDFNQSFNPQVNAYKTAHKELPVK